MGTPRWSLTAFTVALLSLVSLTACAARQTRGESAGLIWSVSELTTSERPATMPGYKGDGRVSELPRSSVTP
jgi:hypothetical protein